MSIKVTGIDEVIFSFERIIKGYPGESAKFLRREGKKLSTRIKKKSKSKINRVTGNYEEGITVQKPYKYYKSEGGKSKDSVKVYGKRPPAYHTHLIEYGHKKVLWGNRTAERVRAFYVYSEAKNEYKSTFENNCEAFINNLISSL